MIIILYVWRKTKKVENYGLIRKFYYYLKWNIIRKVNQLHCNQHLIVLYGSFLEFLSLSSIRKYMISKQFSLWSLELYFSHHARTRFSLSTFPCKIHLLGQFLNFRILTAYSKSINHCDPRSILEINCPKIQIWKNGQVDRFCIWCFINSQMIALKKRLLLTQREIICLQNEVKNSGNYSSISPGYTSWDINSKVPRKSASVTAKKRGGGRVFKTKTQIN